MLWVEEKDPIGEGNVDKYGADARFEDAQKLKETAEEYNRVAADCLSQASEASKHAQRASNAAAELLKGSNEPEVFAVVAEYLKTDEE